MGIDVGGTFTDLVAVRDGELISAKVRSLPHDQSLGVMAAIEASGLERSEHRRDRPRHDRVDERAARASRRPHGARDDRALP